MQTRLTQPVRLTPASSADQPTRVLLAEDNLINQKIAMRLLQKLGCHVDVALNGLEAVAMWKQAHYGIVFMDCHMPEMDGFAATEEIRSLEGRQKDLGHTAIVALTANTLACDRERCFAAGMDDFVPKPIPHDALNRVLQRWDRGKSEELPVPDLKDAIHHA